MMPLNSKFVPDQVKQILLGLGNFSGRYRKQVIATVITIATAIGVVGMREFGAWQAVELKGLDYLFLLRPPELKDDRFVIVEISEDDIQRQSKWPWSDQLFADLINRISNAKASVIVIDKYLDIPISSGRKNLVQSMKTAKNVVNVTFIEQANRRGIELAQDLADVSYAGFANFVTDAGLVARRALLAVDYDSLALQAVKLYLQTKSLATIDFDPKNQTFVIKNKSRTIPIPRLQKHYGGYHNIDASGYQILLNYRGKERSFTHISAVDLLQGKIDPKILRDRIVLIGVTAVSVKDSYSTPYSTGEDTGIMYGVEVHANIMSQLLSAALDDRPFIQVWNQGWESLWIAVWTLAGGALAIYSPKVLRNLGILVVLAGSLGILVYLAFINALWIPFFPAIAGMILANTLVVSYEFSSEQADRQLLMGIFSRHVSKELVEIIWDKRDLFIHEGRISGQEVFVTVLFTDMRNFSTGAEAQKPGETLDWLNEYLGAIASVVLEHGGMVDKYIGDAVMAVFGVPVPHISEAERLKDAQNAVSAAIGIAKKLTELNQTWMQRGLPPTVTGIGINTGVVIAGSLGSKERLEYSVIGDVVNVAARLESLNKEVDGGEYHILISEETLACLEDKFVTEFAGNIALKGRTSETAIHRVLDHA
ncbi:putative transmembrane sensor domain protein [Synechococcus sp. PCC 7502]|uniref:CHASE2 domain-containing protein n=1 Tax=Synechococcus sp. PCC 7502 TaxID=1173263 RepID=UPI00029F87B2|nr:adenylate/guanylate cyclase domain-containing protein [Synechococcus sp. PCC 7502]AFY74739.1 putative transmembrane sensor domain protein [Synechococcus sp. PCC 7502]